MQKKILGFGDGGSQPSAVTRHIVWFMLFFALSMLLTACSREVEYLNPGTEISYSDNSTMTINGKGRTWDLAILPDGKVQPWSPHANHYIGRKELEEIVTDQVKILIIGAGYDGVAHLTPDGVKYVDEIKKRGIEVHLQDTPGAVKLYNSLPKEGLLACFHLTC